MQQRKSSSRSSEPVATSRSEQLPLNIDIASVNREVVYRGFKEQLERLQHRVEPLPETVELTPSDLTTLQGCFRYFQWTRILGQVEPGVTAGEGHSAMRQGSLAHRILETVVEPPADVLREKGLMDLQAVFHSDEWKTFSQMDVERELPFIMHIRASGHDCFIRGRMDAVTSGGTPRIVDYKYAQWRDGGDVEYEIQMTAYCLAAMKNLGVDRAIGELWFLKQPMKIVRREFMRGEAETRLSGLLDKYFGSLASGVWPTAERTYCDAVACGFREQCWPR